MNAMGASQLATDYSGLAEDFHLSAEELEFFNTNGYIGPFKCFDEDLGEPYSELMLGKKRYFPLLDDMFQKTNKGKIGKIKGKLKGKAEQVRDTAYGKMQTLSGEKGPLGKPRHWYKSTHFLIPEVGKLGKLPQIVDRMQSILGNDLLLWSCQIMNKKAQSHRWHEDVEHVEWTGATVWMGIDNVGPGNTMKVIPGSHLYGISPQELAVKDGADLSSDESILAALRKTRPEAEIVTIEMKPGWAFIFAGRAWHASHDVTDKVRSAVIFQYCAPSERVRIPMTYEPPHVTFHPAQPWVMRVAGEDKFGVNHVMEAPPLTTDRLAGQAGVVTGGSRGVGLAIAARLASHGAKVGLFARDEKRLKTAKKLLEYLYDADVAIHAGDLADAETVETGLKSIESQIGPLDILVNNAGLFRNLGPFWDFDVPTWVAEMSTNLVAPYLTARYAAKGMVARGKGTIINFAGGGAGQAIPYGSSYSVGKAGSARLSECMAEDCKGTGVRVYGMDPGFVRTNMTAGNAVSESALKWRPHIKNMLDSNTDQSPDHAANLCVRLITDDSFQEQGRIGLAGPKKQAYKLRYTEDDVKFLVKSLIKKTVLKR
ncbi:MAG: SDR family NAD(P)-dependent oxidoreductase [Sphingobium sp.]